MQRFVNDCNWIGHPLCSDQYLTDLPHGSWILADNLPDTEWECILDTGISYGQEKHMRGNRQNKLCWPWWLLQFNEMNNVHCTLYVLYHFSLSSPTQVSLTKWRQCNNTDRKYYCLFTLKELLVKICIQQRQPRINWSERSACTSASKWPLYYELFLSALPSLSPSSLLFSQKELS